MNAYGNEHQPAPNSWRQGSWIVALLVGLGLGALLVGPIGRQLWFMGGHGSLVGMVSRGAQESHAHGRSARQQNQPIVPDTKQQQRAPRDADPGSGSKQQPRGGNPRGLEDQPGVRGLRRERFGLFFPLAQLRLIVPLLLMGAGAWLRWGRGSGRANGGGSGDAYRQEGQVEPTPAPYDPPLAGGTRLM